MIVICFIGQLIFEINAVLQEATADDDTGTDVGVSAV